MKPVLVPNLETSTDFERADEANDQLVIPPCPNIRTATFDHVGMAVPYRIHPEREAAVTSTLRRPFETYFLDPPPGFEAGHVHLPRDSAISIGGDFYGLHPLEEGRWALLIGDASGSGPQAAAIASRVRRLLRLFAREGPWPAVLLQSLNGALLRQLLPDQFASLFYGVFEPGRNVFRYASGGHEPGVLETPDGVRKLLSPTGPVLGVMEDGSYEEAEVGCPEGASLLVLTDGITEARRGNDFFGYAGIERRLMETFHLSAGERVRTLMEAVRDFTGVPLRDDAAMLLLRRSGKGV